MSGAKSEALFREAERLIPGGVNSPVRAWRAVGGHPRFIERAEGARIFDVDGRGYLDFVGSWGPMILGHAAPDVVSAIREAAARGTSYGAPTVGEIELARRIVDAVPSIERVRLTSSGTEATMSALRLARAFAGRPKIVKFAGCYHGHADALLVRAGSGATTLGVPDSEGVPEAVTALTRVAEFNQQDEVEAFLRAEGREIAAVILEPIPANMGVVPPKPGFLERLRERTREAGALLVFDEVITGFRVARGGAQERYGVTPDLTTLGKIIGGGMPVGAFGGRRDVMQKLAPLGPVYQAGTLSGNPLAMAAGIATLEIISAPGFYAALEKQTAHLLAGLEDAARKSGVPFTTTQVGSMFGLFFGSHAIRTFADVMRCDAARFARFFHGMLARGVYLAPSAYEAGFVSGAHGDADIDATIAAAADVFGGLAGG